MKLGKLHTKLEDAGRDIFYPTSSRQLICLNAVLQIAALVRFSTYIFCWKVDTCQAYKPKFS